MFFHFIFDFEAQEREKIEKLFSNHALESDDKEGSEYAYTMIVKPYLYIST